MCREPAELQDLLGLGTFISGRSRIGHFHACMGFLGLVQVAQRLRVGASVVGPSRCRFAVWGGAPPPRRGGGGAAGGGAPRPEVW